MKQICELNDMLVLGIEGRSAKAPRITARAIVKNQDGQYAVMYADRFKLHSLPGGGVEEGEDVLTALHREIYEETGCICDRIQELGIVSENRGSMDYTQINYYFVVTTKHTPVENHLTETELQNRTVVKWVTFDELVRVINEQQFDRVQGKYLKARDVAALREYETVFLAKKISCVWEHNGDDTLLYAVDFPGAFARGENLAAAMEKLVPEIQSYLSWAGWQADVAAEVEIIQDQPCGLQVRDADSDVLFESEKEPLSMEDYQWMKALVLKSAADFQTLFDSIPNPDAPLVPARTTFYGKVPSTAREMYAHTKSVNAYYFAEINVEADNEGSILDCRRRGFEALEKLPDFLNNSVIEGSYGEFWTLRKVLRRFIWHDRIHARAMYRRGAAKFGRDRVCNVFMLCDC